MADAPGYDWPPVPIDTAGRVAAAYRRRAPRYPVIPETVGLAIVLLVNRSDVAERAVDRTWCVDPPDEALCAPAEAFAATLTGTPSSRAWRGGALASLRTLAGAALHGVPGRPWVDREPVTAAVHAYLAGWPDPVPAFDALLSCFRDNARKLAGYDSMHESPADSRCLRAALSRDITLCGLFANPEDRRLWCCQRPRTWTVGDRPAVRELGKALT